MTRSLITLSLIIIVGCNQAKKVEKLPKRYFHVSAIYLRNSKVLSADMTMTKLIQDSVVDFFACADNFDKNYIIITGIYEFKDSSEYKIFTGDSTATGFLNCDDPNLKTSYR